MLNSSHRLAGFLLAAATGLLTAVSVSAAAVSAPSSPYPPACPKGAHPGANPPYACVHTSYESDAYVKPLIRGPVSITHHIVGHGHYAYVEVDVKVGFSNALPECPAGGVPLSDIPCQMDTVGFGMTGQYIPGQRRLGPGASGDPAGCTPQADTGTCTFDFRLYEDVSHGRYVGVMQASVLDLTQNPGNDLGDAGFEFSVGVVVPKVS